MMKALYLKLKKKNKKPKTQTITVLCVKFYKGAGDPGAKRMYLKPYMGVRKASQGRENF